MARKKAKRRKAKAQDVDVLQLGPIEITRSGRLIASRNTASKARNEEYRSRLAKEYDKVVQGIDKTVLEIANLICGLEPLEVLKRAWWESAMLHISIESEDQVGEAESHAVRMVDYLQSVIVGAPLSTGPRRVPNDDDWVALSKHVRSLFQDLALMYPLVESAHRESSGEVVDRGLDEYAFKAHGYWCRIRGRRYSTQNREFFQRLLSPHNEVLQRVLGATAEECIALVMLIQERQTRGLGRAFDDMTKLYDEVSTAASARLGAGATQEEAGEMMRRVVEEQGREGHARDVFERMFGEGLFELVEGRDAPSRLLQALAYGPGEDTDFFKSGEFCGWPMRVWPVWKRPLLRVDGRFYFFDYYSVVDRLYRTVQRLIHQGEPSYDEEWNRRQKGTSEGWALALFERMLPGAEKWAGVQYPDPDHPGQWAEVDGVVRYDDALFIVEVKAGAFAMAPPSTDFSKYLRSVSRLVAEPCEQAARFLRYARSAHEVPIFDGAHREIGRVALPQCELVVPCAVSMDNISELGAQLEHLGPLGVATGKDAMWVVSIEDLMVYADIMRNPLIFLHFMERRLAAAKSGLMTTEDELDHLGLYFKHNDYVEYARSMRGGKSGQSTRLTWIGYRKEIDCYYHLLASEGVDRPPEQGMPEELGTTLRVLAAKGRVGRRRAAHYLLSYAGSARNDIWAGISGARERQKVTGRPFPMTVGASQDITVFCWEDGRLPRNAELARRHAITAMGAAKKSGWYLLELVYGSDGLMRDAEFCVLSLGALSAEEQAVAVNEGPVLAGTRVKAMQRTAGAKIGRNDQCPCGSGKKYKKCHGR